jgi:hypothetical protein
VSPLRRLLMELLGLAALAGGWALVEEKVKGWWEGSKPAKPAKRDEQGR